MPWWFWLKRFLFAFVVAGAVLFVVHLFKGHGIIDAAWFALLWGAITAAVFTLSGYIRYRRHPACMLPPSGKP